MYRSFMTFLAFCVGGAGCGSALLDRDGEADALPVRVPVWRTWYAPGLRVATPTPVAISPRDVWLTSSDPSVAEATRSSHYSTVYLVTRRVGESEIQMFSDEQLLWTETIRVRQPASVEFMLDYPDVVPAFAIDSAKSLRLLRLGQAPAVVRFYEVAGLPIIAAGAVRLGRGFVRPDASDFDCFELQEILGPVCRAEDQLNSGDRIWVAAGEEDGVEVRLSMGASSGVVFPVSGGVDHVQPSDVSALEVLVGDADDGDQTLVVVYGKLAGEPWVRVMGLSPTITVGGSVNGVAPMAGMPWVAALATTSGTLEVRWHGLVETIELDGGE